MCEMPGISPEVARFARWVRDAGFTVFVPSLFGRDGAVPEVEAGVEVFRKACVSAEFRALGANRSSPVTSWLRGLARLAHEQCGGPGDGGDRNVLHGQLRAHDDARAGDARPVLSQPSLPLDEPAGLEISAEELATVPGRLEQEDLTGSPSVSPATATARRSASPPMRRRSASASSVACCLTARPTSAPRRSSSMSSRARTAS